MAGASAHLIPSYKTMTQYNASAWHVSPGYWCDFTGIHSFPPFSHLSGISHRTQSVSGFLLHLVNFFSNLQVEKRKIDAIEASTLHPSYVMASCSHKKNIINHHKKGCKYHSINSQNGRNLTAQFCFVPGMSLSFLGHYLSMVWLILVPSIFIDC